MAADQASWPIVVFGAPRSGTTYLAALLNTHPEVNITNETRVFSWLHAAARKLPENERAVQVHRSAFVDCLAETLPEVVRGFYRRLDPDARYWGDKNPFYAANDGAGVLDTIADFYPGARFVNIIRDGRNVITSLLRRQAPDGVPWASFERVFRSWVSHVDNGISFGNRHSPEEYFELRFEDLVADDLAMAKRLFAFLGIDLATETVRFCEQQQAGRTPLSAATTVGAIGAPQWRLALSVEEQLACLQQLGDHLVRLGYETEESLAELHADIADLG